MLSTSKQAEYLRLFNLVKSPLNYQQPTKVYHTRNHKKAHLMKEAITFFHGGCELRIIHGDEYMVWSNGYQVQIGVRTENQSPIVTN